MPLGPFKLGEFLRILGIDRPLQARVLALGLSQIYGFVRQSLGELDIRSQPGEEAAIQIKLPCVAAPLAVDIATEQSPAEIPRQASTLLVIDDDPFVRDVVFDALSAAGYHVVAAEDGPSGLARLDHVTPAAAIIDFIMPGMNGAEVARRVHERLPGLPIVFISGYADTDALRGVAGAVILRKPSRSWTCSRWSLASCTDCGGVSGSTAEAGDHDNALTPGRPSPKGGRPLHMGGKVPLARTHHVWTVASIQTPDIPP